MSRRLVFCLPLLLALAPRPGNAQLFVFHLRGDQEVPPIPSLASGGCFGSLDQMAAELELTCTHDIVGATLIHVHSAPAGVNGPIVFDLGDPASPVTATWTGMTPGNIADLLAGDLYVNIHTAGRPDGEIRGQMLTRTVDLVPFTADGAQMVPPNASPATATCSADLDGPATGLQVGCTHNVASPISAHVHSGPAGTNGPLVFTFPSPASPLSALVPLTPELVADFAAGFLYLELHGPVDESQPSLDIRGQIGSPPAPPTTGTIRVVEQTSPPGGTGFGFTTDVPGGPASFSLDDAETQTLVDVPPGEHSVMQDDPSVTPGGWALAAVSCDDADSTADPFSRTAVVDLQAGEVVTCTFQNFATAPTSDVFLFHLDGEQEVPPVASAASGGCYAEFDAGASELSLLCVHDVVGATIMHLHRGAAGAVGPIVFDLGAPTPVVQATWSGMIPADVADLFAGNLYANIHTSGRPDGEIRGQVLPRTVDSFEFPADASQVVPPGASPATGDCFADLNDLATALVVECTHDLPLPTSASLHEGAAGVNGPLVFTFPTATSPFSADVPTAPRLLADFAAGFLYVEILAGEPGGETGTEDAIRGQLAPSGTPQTGTAVPSVGGLGLLVLVLALGAVGWLCLRRSA